MTHPRDPAATESLESTGPATLPVVLSTRWLRPLPLRIRCAFIDARPSSDSLTGPEERSATFARTLELAERLRPTWHVLRVAMGTDDKDLLDALVREATRLEFAFFVLPQAVPGITVHVFARGMRAEISQHVIGAGAGMAAWKSTKRRASGTRNLRVAHQLYELDLSANVHAVPLAADVQFGFAGRERVEHRPLRYAPTIKDAREFLERHERCIGAWMRGDVVFRMWACDIEDARTRLAAPVLRRGGALYIHDVFTDPVVRGRGLYKGALAWLAREARSEGRHERILVLVAEDNVGAVRALLGAGFRETQT